MSIEIIDDDFSCIINSHHIADAIIKIYDKRNLNVAVNLILYVKYLYEGTSQRPDIYQVLLDFENSVPEIIKYREEIQKYLLLV